jgi:hypothetical protein
MPRNQKLTKVIVGRTVKVATVEPGGILVLFDDQSKMKIKTAGPATIPQGGKVKSVHEAKAKFKILWKLLPKPRRLAHRPTHPSLAPPEQISPMVSTRFFTPNRFRNGSTREHRVCPRDGSLNCQMRVKTLTFTGLIFGKAKRDLRREEDPRYGDFSRRSC